MRTLRTSRAVVLAALLATVIEFWLGCLVYGPSVVAVAFVCFFCLWKLCTRIISDVRNRKKKNCCCQLLTAKFSSLSALCCHCYP